MVYTRVTTGICSIFLDIIAMAYLFVRKHRYRLEKSMLTIYLESTGLLHISLLVVKRTIALHGRLRMV